MTNQDYSTLSDAELMALINQPEQPPQPQARSSQIAPMGPAADAPYIPPSPPPVPVQAQSLPDISQPRDPAAYQPTTDDRMRGFARGVPILGAAADEGNAALAALLAPTVEPMLRSAPQGVQDFLGYDQRADIGGEGDYKARFDAAMNLQRFKDDRYDQGAPNDSMTSKAAGTVLGSIAGMKALAPISGALAPEIGLLPRVGAGIVEGGALGGAQGYADGEGGFNDKSRLEGAGKGAVLGSLAGGAVPIGLTAGGAAWKATGGKVIDMVKGARAPVVAPKTEAEALAQALKGGGEAAGDTVAPALNQDLAEVLASRQKVPVTEVPASAEADAYARIARAMQRQRQTPEELGARVTGLGERGMIADSGDAMRNLARDAVNRPSGAEDIARAALDLRQKGLVEGGEFAIRPSSGRILDQAAEGLGVDGKQFYSEIDNQIAARKAAADPAYAKLREGQPVAVADLKEFAGSDMFAKAYDRARAISQKEFVKVPGVEGEAIMPLPAKMPENLDWRTLDLMKQGMDDLISTSTLQGIGNTERGAAKGYLQRYVARLDELNPDYKVARDAFAGPTAMKNAIEEGRSVFKEDAPVLAKKLSDLSEGEQQMYRLGALQGLKDKLGNADVTYDAARQAGVLKPNQLERFKELFPSKEAFAKFADMLANEQTMFQTRGAILGNSTTAKQLAAMADNDGSPMESFAQTAFDAKTGNVMGLIRALGRVGGPAKLSEPSAEALASILTNMDQAAIPGVVQRLTEAQKRQMLADALRQSTGAGAASAAAGAGSPK